MSLFPPPSPGFPSRVAAITPDDDVDLPFTASSFRAGAGGDVKVTTVGGDTEVIPNVLTGETVVLGVTRIHETGTTASSIVVYV